MTTLTARTDVHRPAAMNPAAYRVMAYPCVFTEESLETGRDETVCEMEAVADDWEAMGSPMYSTWDGHREDRCDHCGSRVKYTAVVQHVATGDLITVGRDCVRRFFNENWTLIQQNAEAKARRARNTAKFLALYPEAAAALTWATEGDGRAKKFVADLTDKAIVKGYDVNPGQASALVQAYETSLKPVTFKEGRRALGGIIVKATIKRDDYASDRNITMYKVCITVLTEEGFRAWGTLPFDFACGLKPGDEAELTGRRVDFTATLTAKDAGFATYSRPAKMTLEARPGGKVCGDPEKEAEAAQEGTEAPAEGIADTDAAPTAELPADGAGIAEWAAYFAARFPAGKPVKGEAPEAESDAWYGAYLAADEATEDLPGGRDFLRSLRRPTA